MSRDRTPLWPEGADLMEAAERKVRSRVWVTQMHRFARWMHVFCTVTPRSELEKIREDPGLSGLWAACPAECRPPPGPKVARGTLDVLKAIDEAKFDADRALEKLAEAGVTVRL